MLKHHTQRLYVTLNKVKRHLQQQSITFRRLRIQGTELLFNVKSCTQILDLFFTKSSFSMHSIERC